MSINFGVQNKSGRSAIRVRRVSECGPHLNHRYWAMAVSLVRRLRTSRVCKSHRLCVMLASTAARQFLSGGNSKAFVLLRGAMHKLDLHSISSIRWFRLTCRQTTGRAKGSEAIGISIDPSRPSKLRPKNGKTYRFRPFWRTACINCARGAPSTIEKCRWINGSRCGKAAKGCRRTPLAYLAPSSLART